jgi:hypothetical protein
VFNKNRTGLLKNRRINIYTWEQKIKEQIILHKKEQSRNKKVSQTSRNKKNVELIFKSKWNKSVIIEEQIIYTREIYEQKIVELIF